MIEITPHLSLDESEINITFIRASGPGGQNVNKVSTAAQLRFNIKNSHSLSDSVKTRLLTLLGRKITMNGEILINASRFRTQNGNKKDAINRLITLIQKAVIIPKKRLKTKPSFASIERRLQKKKLHSKNKTLRRNKLNTEY